MNVTGIIAEYNPFHNGHFYHLEKARIETEADFVVVLLSGDFVQRGEPAILDKWVRTRMALVSGADLVLELPSFAATGSAEYFAVGAVSIFSASGVVDRLSFGSESGDLAALSSLAALLCEEPAAYQKRLKEELKKGVPFPKARQNAFLQQYPSYAEDGAASLLSSPNNLLGLEYLKALIRTKSSIKPHTIMRSGNGYHDTSMEAQSFSSASGIRNALFSSDWAADAINHIKNQMPDSVFSVLEEHLRSYAPVSIDDFSSLLHYRLLSFREPAQLFDYCDVSSDIAERIFNLRSDYTALSSFTALLKTRQITYTRAARSLLHILLDMKQENFDAFFRTIGSDGYLRILGFRKSAAPLLSMIKKKSQLPMVTKLADAKRQLNARAFAALEQDLFCSSVYHAAIAQKHPGHKYNEFRISPIIF